jgi:hypothetical protein
MEKLTYCKRNDYRSTSLHVIVDGLHKSIKELEKNIDEIHWYDGDWLREETEPIYGLAFIAFQNYIIGSIADIEGVTETKHQYYKKDAVIQGYKHTTIELIIALANYAKHKDEKLWTSTIKILDGFSLNYRDVIYLDEAPIFQGLNILDENYYIYKIKDYVTAWRESLWLTND